MMRCSQYKKDLMQYMKFDFTVYQKLSLYKVFYEYEIIEEYFVQLMAPTTESAWDASY